MKRKYRSSSKVMRILTVAAVMVVALGACGGDDGDGTGTGTTAPAVSEVGGTTTAAAEPEVDDNAEYHHAINFTYTTLDPHKGGLPPWLRPVYDRLLQYKLGPDGGPELSPMLATSYTVSADGLSISLELRDDVTFQDGTQFDAAAVKANIERAKSPAPVSTVASNIASISSVEVVDATHVVIHLSTPDPSIPYYLADSTTGSMISPAALNNADLASKPVGSGPFTLVSAQQNADVVYERWDDYWNRDAIKIKKLTMSTITDNNVRYNGVLSGEFDSAYIAPPLDLQAESLESEGYTRLTVYQPGPFGLMLNSDKPPLNDVRVRRAISMALDRQVLAETILEDIGVPAYQTFAPGQIGYLESLDKDPYDPDEAKKLVQDAGAEGATLNILQNTGATQLQQLAEVVQQELGKIGLTVKLVPQPATEIRLSWRSGSYDGSVDGMIGSPDVAATLRRAYLAFENPAKSVPQELIDLSAKANSAEFGSPERTEAFEDVSVYLAENPVHVPLNRSWFVILARPNVVGAENLTEADWNGTDIEFQDVGKTSDG
jgi:ABC-type transport system substrate-binding protein